MILYYFNSINLHIVQGKIFKIYFMCSFYFYRKTYSYKIRIISCNVKKKSKIVKKSFVLRVSS